MLPQIGGRAGRQQGRGASSLERSWPKPHRLERYLASDDPEFESKAAEILGLYLRPRQHAAVFCVDEKTAIQPLDRLDPALPLSPGRAERHGFEYYRHGTLSQGERLTRYENARRVAERFPVLEWKLPPKRRAWESEHYRISIFAAAALAIAPGSQ
jgi:hypothetical protein